MSPVSNSPVRLIRGKISPRCKARPVIMMHSVGVIAVQSFISENFFIAHGENICLIS